MESKEWLIMLVPICAHGVIVFIFQKIISTKIERQNRKNSLKDEVVLLFWKKLQSLNTSFIHTNISILRNPNNLNVGLLEIENRIMDIIEYYDTNVYDLCDFKEEYNRLTKAWDDFVAVSKSLENITLTQENQRTLGEKIQKVKENNLKLISSVRKKY